MCPNSTGCVPFLSPFNQGTHISPTLHTVLTWASVDQYLCYHMGSLGNNGFWSLGTIKSCGHDIRSVLCQSRCLKQGYAHHRADVTHHRAYILESTLHQVVFLGFTKWLKVTTLACIPLLKPERPSTTIRIQIQNINWLRLSDSITNQTSIVRGSPWWIIPWRHNSVDADAWRRHLPIARRTYDFQNKPGELDPSDLWSDLWSHLRNERQKTPQVIWVWRGGHVTCQVTWLKIWHRIWAQLTKVGLGEAYHFV